MELHHHSCILPSNAPAIPEPEPYIPSRVLQERSANRLHEYSEDISPRKRSPLYADRLGGHFTGNLASHFTSDKSEAQIELETKRLLKLLKKCDKYQKYRERQPAGSAISKGDKDKDKDKEQRWPDHLEEAFFRALVRYPPMGRRKLMQDGQLRGRNELVAGSIEIDTGEPRTRKQVSSHIQVLKPMLADTPQILVYMSTEDMSNRGGRGRHATSQSRHRNASSKYGTSQANLELHQSLGYLPSSVALARIQSSYEEPPYTVANFDMFVEAANDRKHGFSQSSNSRSQLDDLYVIDSTTWHKQYPEFKFHQLEEFKDRHVIVCDATIKVMTTKTPPGAELKITFDLNSKCDLSVYDSIECHTRFFENGKLSLQPDGETHTYEEYKAEHDIMHVHFGSGFWVQKMRKLGDLLSKASAQEELTARTNYTERVRSELQNMTASQDIYGVRNGEVCLLTILWRFSQTRTSNDTGRMTWRVINFGNRSDAWVKEEEIEHIRNAKELIPVSYTPTSLSMLTMPTSSHSLYPNIPLDYHQSFGGHQPSLDLDVLGLESITAPDFSQPNSASSLVTDFSHTHPLPPLAHSQEPIGVSQPQDFTDINDFDFNGGHITISGCLEPAINLGAYEPYAQSHLSPHPNSALPLPTLSSLSNHLANSEPQGLSDMELSSLANINATMPASCYATKPSWHHPSLISHLESAAEQFGVGDLIGADDGQGGLMGDGGLWKLQAVFGGGDDTGVGAEGRRDSKVSAVAEFSDRERDVWGA